MTTDLAVQDDQHDTALANPVDAASALTHYLGTGDLSRLTGEQRAALYLDTCRSLDLNPRTRPFDWIEFWDPESKAKKLTLYPNRSCAEQLRRQHQISVRIVSEEIVGKLFKVVVEGRRPNGVSDTATSYVPLTDKDGNALVGTRLANAFMKGQTTAKRRLTFSMVGMYSPPDVEELQRARIVVVDGNGNVIDNPTREQRYLAQTPAAAAAIGEPTFETAGRLEDAPLAGTAGQQVRPDELQQPRRPAGPAPRLRASDEEVRRWLGAWFAAVKGTSLDDDEARHRFVRSYSNGRTASLRAFLSACTERQAGDFLAHVRALAEADRAESTADMGLDATDIRPAGMTPEGHAAATLTGAPAAQQRIRPEREGEYSRAEWEAFYRTWSARLQNLDVIRKPLDVKTLKGRNLIDAVWQVIAEGDELEEILSSLPTADEDTEPVDDGEVEQAVAF